MRIPPRSLCAQLSGAAERGLRQRSSGSPGAGPHLEIARAYKASVSTCCLNFNLKPDPQMHLRISVYTGLLLQDLVRSREISGSAAHPPVLALVLYNGKERWPGVSGPYRCIDAIRDPLPAAPGNLVALLFELERSGRPGRFDPGCREAGRFSCRTGLGRSETGIQRVPSRVAPPGPLSGSKDPRDGRP